MAKIILSTCYDTRERVSFAVFLKKQNEKTKAVAS